MTIKGAFTWLPSVLDINYLIYNIQVKVLTWRHFLKSLNVCCMK